MNRREFLTGAVLTLTGRAAARKLTLAEEHEAKLFEARLLELAAEGFRFTAREHWPEGPHLAGVRRLALDGLTWRRQVSTQRS